MKSVLLFVSALLVTAFARAQAPDMPPVAPAGGPAAGVPAQQPPPPLPPAGGTPSTMAPMPPGASPGGQPPEAAKANTPPAAPPQPRSELSGILDQFDYDPRGRRDPFALPTADKPVQPGDVHGPLLPIHRISIQDAKILAILWDVSDPRAILSDPATKAKYTVRLHTKVGPNNGYIAAIREGEVVIVEFEDQGGRLVPVARVKTIGN